MNRRNFLNSLIGGVVATAAVRTFPFRVFSFPSEIQPGLYNTMSLIDFNFGESFDRSLIFAKNLTGEMARAFEFEWADEKAWQPPDDFEKRFGLNARSH